MSYCAIHNVNLSSPCGMFDTVCVACEYEMSQSDARDQWERDASDPTRDECYPEVCYGTWMSNYGFPAHPSACGDSSTPAGDEIPF